jgi:hypothetical protein
MAMAAVYILMRLSISEIELADKRQEEVWAAQITLAMSSEQQAAHAADETARPLSYFIDKAAVKSSRSEAPKPRSRKNTLINTMRKISNISLRRADSTAALASKPEHTIPPSGPMLRSKSQGTVMLHNLRNSVAIVPPDMRDTMAKFVTPSGAPIINDRTADAPFLEYGKDNIVLLRANLQGLINIITSSCGAENQECAAMVLMTFRMFSDAIKLAEEEYQDSVAGRSTRTVVGKYIIVPRVPHRRNGSGGGDHFLERVRSQPNRLDGQKNRIGCL